jgi:tRNA U34 5-carboxymethylaminomethyl modifying GTPase MnmE/TrmE
MQDTICAISTPAGTGAIALIRISGDKAWNAVKHCFIAQNEKKIVHRMAYSGEFYDKKLY